MTDIPHFTGFQWDEGNRDKNWTKHKVSNSECEEVFFNESLIVPDIKHSEQEQRYYALGRTNEERLLFISFTIRENLIRVISARAASRKEKQQYETDEKNSTI